MYKHNFLIAAPSSGAGKTTATIGLLRALHNRGLTVQAFKSGPDYIDPKFHELATNRASINLDRFFCNSNEIHDLFNKYACDTQVSVIEGVMGLFDGYNGQEGSSADLAKTLNIPVVLLVNGASVAYSIAALLYGFKNFDPKVQIAGVIFNKVSSQSHYKIMQDAAKSVGLTALGHIPRKNDISVPSRHLGLNIDTKYRFTQYADMLAQHIEQYVDIDLLLEKTKTLASSSQLPTPNFRLPSSDSRLPSSDSRLPSSDFRLPSSNSRLPSSNSQLPSSHSIAVARDEAFNFTYAETISLFKSFANVVFFSPIADKCMPKADYLYLPGGYPEFFLEELSGNKSMLQSVREYAETGGKILAECGGMLYLCKSMIDEKGQLFPLVGFFDMQSSMQNMKLRLGYRKFTHNDRCYKGHEFHYSKLLENSYTSICQQYGAKGQTIDTKILKKGNVIASYTHLYLKNELDFKNLFD